MLIRILIEVESEAVHEVFLLVAENGEHLLELGVGVAIDGASGSARDIACEGFSVIVLELHLLDVRGDIQSSLKFGETLSTFRSVREIIFA